MDICSLVHYALTSTFHIVYAAVFDMVRNSYSTITEHFTKDLKGHEFLGKSYTSPAIMTIFSMLHTCMIKISNKT